MNINVKSPDGNIFVIIGRFKNLVKDLEKDGADTSEHRKIINDYLSMSYDEILDKIEAITNETMTFSGRQ